MDLSICIPTYNMKDFLKKCLSSIYENKPEINFEIIVVDDNSTDETSKMVKKNFSDVILIRHTVNQEKTYSTNQAFERAKGEFILWLGADSIVLEDAIDKMVDFIRGNLDVGAVGPKLLNFDGTLQHNGRSFPSFLKRCKQKIGAKIYKNYEFVYEKKRNYDEIEEVDEISAEGMLFRRNLLDEVGYWDESLIQFYQETDWHMRMKKKGWKVYYLPDARIKHYWSHRRTIPPNEVFQIYCDELYLFEKHYGSLQVVVLRVFVFLETMFRVLRLLIKWLLFEHLSKDMWILQFRILKLAVGKIPTKK